MSARIWPLRDDAQPPNHQQPKHPPILNKPGGDPNTDLGAGREGPQPHSPPPASWRAAASSARPGPFEFISSCRANSKPRAPLFISSPTKSFLSPSITPVISSMPCHLTYWPTMSARRPRGNDKLDWLRRLATCASPRRRLLHSLILQNPVRLVSARRAKHTDRYLVPVPSVLAFSLDSRWWWSCDPAPPRCGRGRRARLYPHDHVSYVGGADHLCTCRSTCARISYRSARVWSYNVLVCILATRAGSCRVVAIATRRGSLPAARARRRISPGSCLSCRCASPITNFPAIADLLGEVNISSCSYAADDSTHFDGQVARARRNRTPERRAEGCATMVEAGLPGFRGA